MYRSSDGKQGASPPSPPTEGVVFWSGKASCEASTAAAGPARPPINTMMKRGTRDHKFYQPLLRPAQERAPERRMTLGGFMASLPVRTSPTPAQFSSWQRCIESLIRVAGRH